MALRVRPDLTARRQRYQGRSYWVVKEPIGVCGAITPWNYPLNQIVEKVAAAFRDDSELVALSGSYGAEAGESGFFSQYMNNRSRS